MHLSVLLHLAAIVLLGVVAQWAAWRVKLPSILILLLFGFIAGPVLGILNPDSLFGELLTPLVSLSVAVILFEGSLSLRLSELKGSGKVIRNLMSVGMLTTWVIAALGATYILGLDKSISTLLGAILVVSGPTVIIPLMKFVRPIGAVASILKWEGIIIDSVGATLAVIVFEVILAGQFYQTTLMTLFKTVVLGGGVGSAGALWMIFCFKRDWVPDFLHNSATLASVFAVYTASNMIQAESGLLAVTLMGFILANQKIISVRHIAEFKENLSMLLISSVFIVLASRLHMSQIQALGWDSVWFLLLLIFVARPVSVAVSSWGSSLTFRERIFLSWMAPRGIVAAAVAAFFAIRLEDYGMPGADRLVALTFVVIVGTVTIYGLTISPLARWLKVATPNPQGFLILGAHRWSRLIALSLKDAGYTVKIIDNDLYDIQQSRMAGIPAHYANILSEYVLDEVDLGGIGRLLAITENEEVNALATLHFDSVFGMSEVYQLPLGEEGLSARDKVSRDLRGRTLFGKEATFGTLSNRFSSGYVLKKTTLTKEFGFEEFKKHYGENNLLLFVIFESGNIQVNTVDKPLSPQPGQSIIALVKENTA